MTLGRDMGCSVPVEVAGVSAAHCRIERSRQGDRLRVTDLESRNGTFVNGWKVPRQGADCDVGSILRIGEALFVYRELDTEEAAAAQLPPLPGPMNTRHPPLVKAVERIQEYRSRGGPIWLCGPAGSGRSVLHKHLDRLAEEAVWTLETELSKVVLDINYSDEPPPEALAPRVVVFPSLRERIEDLMILVNSLCAPRKVSFSPEMLEALHLYDWPGNVRELRIMLERAFHPLWGAMPGAAWGLELFPDIRHYLERRPPPEGILMPLCQALTEPSIRGVPADLSSTDLRKIMEDNHWKLFPAARGLGISRATLVEALAGAGIRGPAQGKPGDGTGQAPPGIT